MKPEWVSVAVESLFGILAVIFLALSVVRGTPLSRRTWRRIGIIFAFVALVIIAVHQK